MGREFFRRFVDQKHHGERIKKLSFQTLRRSFRDLFFRIGKALAHIDFHLIHSIREKLVADLRDAIFFTHQGKNLSVPLDGSDQVLLSSVDAHETDILPRKMKLP